MAAEELFQGIVGQRQVRYLVAIKQARPVAAADTHEVSGCPRQPTQPYTMPNHRTQQTAQLLSRLRGVVRAVLAQQVSRLPDPGIQQGDRRPQRRRGLQRSEEHTSELQSLRHHVCRLLLEKKNKKTRPILAALEQLLLYDLSPSTNESVQNRRAGCGEVA